MPQEVEPGQAIAFVHANVVPMDSERVLADRTVVVRGGRIEAVGPSADLAIPEDVLAVDAGGHYLMPGLADMHVHVWTEADFLLFLANGVTTVRNMWGSEQQLDWRARIENGELLGPTIYTAGPLMDGSPPIWDGSTVIETAEDAQRAVRDQKEAGYDFIKIYNRLSLEAYEALLASARDQGMPAAGHVPDAVGLDAVLASGQVAIEHLGGYGDATVIEGSPMDLPPGRSISELNRATADALKQIQSGEMAFSDLYDDAKLIAYAEATRDAGVWNVPTIVVFQEIPSDEADEVFSRPEMRYVDPLTRATWDPSTTFYYDGLSDDEIRLMRRWNDLRLHRAEALHEAGARLLLGTDTPNPFVVPGFSIHEELANLVAAGLTPYEAIRAGTRDGAEFLGDLDEWGTLEVGKRADMILLDANPLDDVGNVNGRAGIVVRGRWLSEAKLRSGLEDLAASYEAPKDRFDALDPLPSEGTRSYEEIFEMAYNDVPVGAERVAVETIDGSAAIVAQSVVDPPNDAMTLERLELDSAGACRGLTLQRITSLGEDSLTVEMESGLVVVSGTLGSGEPVDLREPVADNTLCGSSMLATILQIVGRLESLGVDESTEVSSKTLEWGPNFSLVNYSITIARVADEDVDSASGVVTARVFEMDWSSTSANYESKLWLGEDGRILALEVSSQMGLISYRPIL
jgi:imidazolonepropionase-like amidohydrolase